MTRQAEGQYPFKTGLAYKPRGQTGRPGPDQSLTKPFGYPPSVARFAGTPPPTLAEAVAAGTCSFWGDLDSAGLDIFVKLRGLVPHLALSALYGPVLVAAADSATSHPYCTLVDKLGQIEITSNDAAVTRLAAARRVRAVDQEYVSDPDILALAERIMEHPDYEPESTPTVKA